MKVRASGRGHRPERRLTPISKPGSSRRPTGLTAGRAILFVIIFVLAIQMLRGGFAGGFGSPLVFAILAVAVLLRRRRRAPRSGLTAVYDAGDALVADWGGRRVTVGLGEVLDVVESNASPRILWIVTRPEIQLPGRFEFSADPGLDVRELRRRVRGWTNGGVARTGPARTGATSPPKRDRVAPKPAPAISKEGGGREPALALLPPSSIHEYAWRAPAPPPAPHAPEAPAAPAGPWRP